MQRPSCYDHSEASCSGFDFGSKKLKAKVTVCVMVCAGSVPASLFYCSSVLLSVAVPAVAVSLACSQYTVDQLQRERPVSIEIAKMKLSAAAGVLYVGDKTL